MKEKVGLSLFKIFDLCSIQSNTAAMMKGKIPIQTIPVL
ncbi:hypothetical protein Bsel_0684 [[Bacillus] selenitireducens MLS10]|uniref:Uncharacterized protein n=1 Tax=Bacillus selenitireducens (strain ATCC 700615 / DSM 15326 / MLS10) TaxID=439292 RepID=D6XYR1_BACIE|nr:hypothetical protein Bsel_0684 [[Bacillus] selenitireducens MLS10]